MAISLAPVKHDLKTVLWCGPAVVSSITGLPTSVIHKQILYGRRKSGSTGRFAKVVQGTYIGDLIDVLGPAGYGVRRVHNFGNEGPTVAGWLKNRTQEERQQCFILAIGRGFTRWGQLRHGGHWVAVTGRKFVDTKRPQTCFLKDAPGRRTRVNEVWLVTKR